MGFSLKAMWNYKCPRCRQGKIFTEPFEFSKPLAMPNACEYCNQRTEPEPGFYYGAMFVSYALSIIILLIPTLVLVFVFKWSESAAFTFTIVTAVILYLRILRGSRSIWLHLMVKYNPQIADKVKKVIIE